MGGGVSMKNTTGSKKESRLTHTPWLIAWWCGRWDSNPHATRTWNFKFQMYSYSITTARLLMFLPLYVGVVA